MKIRVEKLNEDNDQTKEEPVISHVWCAYESEHCVVLCVDLHKKRQNPTAYQGPGVWFGNEKLVVDDLPFSAMVHAETSRYTCMVTFLDRLLDELRDPKVLWQDTDGYSPWPPENEEEKS
jgi:hypothetical protein